MKDALDECAHFGCMEFAYELKNVTIFHICLNEIENIHISSNLSIVAIVTNLIVSNFACLDQMHAMILLCGGIRYRM